MQAWFVRNARRSGLGSVLLFSALPACSEDEPVQVSVASHEVTFSSNPVTLESGQEKYLCFAGNLPSDREIVVREITADYGPGTHHVFFGWTLAPEPDGTSECPVLFKTTWIPIYLGGVESTPLRMPDGAAVDLGRGKQLVLQLHLQNTSAAPITNRVAMHMKLQDQAEGFVPAGIFGLDNHVIDLPPNSGETTTRMSCKPGKEMNVFSMLGHMHKYGSSLEVFKNSESVFVQQWDFDDQPITPLRMRVMPEDELALECRHSNTTDRSIGYGESSDDEMCASVFYYTPYDRLAGCTQVPDEGPDGGGGSDSGPVIVGAGSCTSQADLGVLRAGIADSLRTCGAECLGEPGPCTAGCIETHAGLTSGCAGCYGALLDCTVQNCLADCASAPDGSACQACRETHCSSAFTTCSGLEG